jgi:hypothetical protein
MAEYPVILKYNFFCHYNYCLFVTYMFCKYIFVMFFGYFRIILRKLHVGVGCL